MFIFPVTHTILYLSAFVPGLAPVLLFKIFKYTCDYWTVLGLIMASGVGKVDFLFHFSLGQFWSVVWIQSIFVLNLEMCKFPFFNANRTFSSNFIDHCICC